MQTADNHAYLDPHLELFFENEQIVIKEAGGLATIKTITDSIRKENSEGTLLIDGGDFFQGSGASVRSQGKIFPPIVQAMDYNLLISGNWEVVYGEEVMMEVMNHYDTNVFAANMFDETTENSLTSKSGLQQGYEFYDGGRKFEDLDRAPQNRGGGEVLFLVTHLGISKQILLANNPTVKDWAMIPMNALVHP